MENTGKFSYIVSSAKIGEEVHGTIIEHMEYIDAIVKHGMDGHRYGGIHEEGLKYVRDNINNEFMGIFGYRHRVLYVL